MVTHASKNNGRLEFMALKYYYKGVGVNALNAVQSAVPPSR